MSLLEVRNLCVEFAIGKGTMEVVSGVSFSLLRGKTLGIIGESGSGKTITCKSLLRILPSNATSSADSILFENREISKLSDHEFVDLRGKSMAMIFQDPVGSFNPVKTVGWHFLHAGLRTDKHRTKSDIINEAIQVLTNVGIPRADDALSSFPHQLSGGMLQRCLIAIVMFLKPSIIIADEPTTNLDNIVERQIVDLFAELREEIDAGFIFITHDMSIAEDVCDDILVMYSGEVVELAPKELVLSRPSHPYTKGLIQTSNELETGAKILTEIPGELTDWRENPNRCRFAPRCKQKISTCESRISIKHADKNRQVRCILPNQKVSK